MPISPADLPLRADGSVYHLNLLPHEIADTIILVGDPQRASQISSYFEKIEVHKVNREFVTYTGHIGNKRFSVVGTGIGSDNIDIVMNELDALVNIDFKTREIKSTLTRLKIIRIGTAGALQKKTGLDAVVISKLALGFDGLLDFYAYHPSLKMQGALEQAQKHFAPLQSIRHIYAAEADEDLLAQFSALGEIGMTCTCIGFYGPQSRVVRAPLAKANFLNCARNFHFDKIATLNFEMETAAIYGLGKLFGHQCISLSAIVANRETGEFSKNPYETVDRLIAAALKIIT